MGSVLTAALALVALPGLAGSRAPSAVEPVPVGAFQPLPVPADTSRSTSIDGARRRPSSSDGASTRTPRSSSRARRPRPVRPAAPRSTSPMRGTRPVRKPPQVHAQGQATFYDDGHTAMRLPRGTTVIICGGGGCVERVVNDYGPQKPSRIVDLVQARLLRRSAAARRGSGTTNGDGLRLLTRDRAPPSRYPSRRPFSCGPVRPPGRPSEAGKER